MEKCEGVARSLHMFTCQTSALHVSEASEVWAATAAESYPGFRKHPSSPPSPWHVTCNHHEGHLLSPSSCRLLHSEHSGALQYSLGALPTATIH